jgi:hypothetical protein
MNRIIIGLRELTKSISRSSKFAVIITKDGDKELYVKKFRREMKKYSWLQQNPDDNLSLSELEYGDIVLFGSSSSYDYTILEGKKALMKLKNILKYDVVTESDRIARALEHYAEKNSVCPCWHRPSRKSDPDVIINVTVTEKKKPFVVNTYDVVDIYDGFVKVGWNIYYIETSRAGKQYVDIDGTTYQIKHNVFGQKYLG